MIDGINNQIEEIQQARAALAAMVESTDVIHRYDDMRLLTTTFVADRLPAKIRQIVEREAMMTVRLQATDKVFVPRSTSVARASTSARPTYASTMLVVSEEEPVLYADIDLDAPDDSVATFEQEEPTDQQQNGTANQDGEHKQKDMPWYVRLICPPCWFDGLSDEPSHPAE